MRLVQIVAYLWNRLIQVEAEAEKLRYEQRVALRIDGIRVPDEDPAA